MRTASVRKRPVAPKATIKAEVPATPAPVKAPFWSRAKAVVVKTTKRVSVFVKTTARKVVSVVSSSAKRVLPVAKRAWTVALRPFLRGIGAAIVFSVLIAGALIAPLATALVLIGTGSLVVLLAKGVKHLESTGTTSRIAHIALRALDIIGRIFQVAFYAVSLLMAAALCSVSWPFAAFTALILTLAYFDVRGAGTIAFLAWCALSGAWALGLLWLLWRGASRIAVRREAEIDVPEYSEIRRTPDVAEDIVTRPTRFDAEAYARGEHAVSEAFRKARESHVAKGAEEVADLVETWADTWDNEQACAACGTHKGAMRLRSNGLPIVTAGSGVGSPTKASTDVLCSECYDAECEDIAITTTGISLKKRSVHVALNAVGRAALPEFASSKADVTKVFWAVTAWWRDRRGHTHERQWDCFHDGKIMATIVYDHTYRVFRTTALGKFLGTKTTEDAAKRLATDALFDEANAVSRMVEALADDAGDVVRETALRPA